MYVTVSRLHLAGAARPRSNRTECARRSGPLSGGRRTSAAACHRTPSCGARPLRRLAESVLALEWCSGRRSLPHRAPRAPTPGRSSAIRPDLTGLFLGEPARWREARATLRLIRRPEWSRPHRWLRDARADGGAMTADRGEGLVSECFAMDPVLTDSHEARPARRKDLKAVKRVTRRADSRRAQGGGEGRARGARLPRPEAPYRCTSAPKAHAGVRDGCARGCSHRAPRRHEVGTPFRGVARHALCRLSSPRHHVGERCLPVHATGAALGRGRRLVCRACTVRLAARRPRSARVQIAAHAVVGRTPFVLEPGCLLRCAHARDYDGARATHAARSEDSRTLSRGLVWNCAAS